MRSPADECCKYFWNFDVTSIPSYCCSVGGSTYFQPEPFSSIFSPFFTFFKCILYSNCLHWLSVMIWTSVVSISIRAVESKRIILMRHAVLAIGGRWVNIFSTKATILSWSIFSHLYFFLVNKFSYLQHIFLSNRFSTPATLLLLHLPSSHFCKQYIVYIYFSHIFHELCLFILMAERGNSNVLKSGVRNSQTCVVCT